MPDIPHDADPPTDADTDTDRRFISLAQEHEVHAWTTSLECTEQELRDAVAAVGNSADAVLNHLMRSKG